MNIDYDKFHDEIAVELATDRETVKFLRVRMLKRFSKIGEMIKHLERKEALHVEFLNKCPEVQAKRGKLIAEAKDDSWREFHKNRLTNHMIAEERTRACRVKYLKMIHMMKKWRTSDIEKLTKPI
jgi:hypothetical protein